MDEPPSYNLISQIFLIKLGASYSFAFAGICILLLISTLIALSEIAILSLEPEELEKCKKSKTQADQTIVSLLEKRQLLLFSMILLNTLVRVGVVTISVLTVSGLFDDEMAFVLSIVGITIILILLGGFVPKIYAEQNKMKIARMFAPTWKVLMLVCSPLTIPLVKFTNAWEKRFVKERVTADELSQVLELATGDKGTSEGEKEILRGIVNFGTLTVKQVMRHRDQISAIEIDSNFDEVLRHVNASGFSRLPVYRKTLDTIEGVLYIKDLLPYLEHPSTFSWQDLWRPGFFVPESKKIDLLLKDFQEKRVHMAIVVNERSMTTGLVTLEDLIEEIIGEINDEFDEVDHAYRKIDDTTFVFDGRTTFQDLCKVLEIDSNTLNKDFDEQESLEKILLELNDAPPHAGDQINYEQFTFVIESIVGKKIKRVRVNVHEQA